MIEPDPPDPQDTDRLRLRPEQRLRQWEQSARPIGELVDAPLALLGRELSRSVLVHPKQPLDAAGRIIERLTAAEPVTPEECLPVADAINALTCIGVNVPDERPRLLRWLPGLTAVEPPFPGRLRGGFAAIALSDQFMAYVAPLPHDVTGGYEFPGDVHKLVGYAAWAVCNNGSLATIENALRRVAEELDVLCDSNQLDEATVLWLARLAFHRLDPGRSLAEVAARAHDWLWNAPAWLEVARSQPVEFPIGATLGDGVYRIEHRLCGTGSNRLYRGVEVATGSPLLIAYDYFRSRRHDIAELRGAISYDAPGLLALAHVGYLDGRRDLWAVVERALPGSTWLPALVGPADPWTAPRKAAELGASAGRMLLGALHVGPALLEVRPEMMWGARLDGHYVVTGLSPRGHALFGRSHEDAVSHPLFLYHYRDPLWREPGFAFDDRSLTFSLAVMVAEWTIGVYPLLQTWGNETAEHMPIDAPRALRTLLERSLSPTLAARPPLEGFVGELVQLAARL